MRKLLVLLLLALPCGAQVVAGTSYVNSGSVVAASGTVTMTTVDANSCVLLAVMLDDDGTTTFNTPTATGLTFAQVSTTVHSTNNFYLLFFRAWTTSSLGSTVITETWNTTSADWLLTAVDFKGTAGTAGNNCSDAIGTVTSATATSAAESVTVTSSAHDQSKYYGAVVVANGATASIVKGASYTNLTANTFNGNFISGLTEISTSAVTPAANTTVDASSVSAAWGIYGVEILKSSGGAVTPKCGLIGGSGMLC